MISRAYNTKIEIFSLSDVSDGFGGKVSNEGTLLKKVWAKISTKNAGRRFTDFGLNEFKNPVIFSIRGTNIDLNEKCFIKYKDKKYLIKGIENVNLDSLELNLYCDEI